jgi:hypothetical protein
MDKYTKCVLTVIAVCLVSISFQLSDTNVIRNAKASGDCGEVRYSPCYVKVINDVRTLPQK